MTTDCHLELSNFYKPTEVCGRCGATAETHPYWKRRPVDVESTEVTDEDFDLLLKFSRTIKDKRTFRAFRNVLQKLRPDPAVWGVEVQTVNPVHERDEEHEIERVMGFIRDRNMAMGGTVDAFYVSAAVGMMTAEERRDLADFLGRNYVVGPVIVLQ